MTESEKSTGGYNLKEEGSSDTWGAIQPEKTNDQIVVTPSGKRPQSAIRRRSLLTKAIRRNRG